MMAKVSGVSSLHTQERKKERKGAHTGVAHITFIDIRP